MCPPTQLPEKKNVTNEIFLKLYELNQQKLNQFLNCVNILWLCPQDRTHQDTENINNKPKCQTSTWRQFLTKLEGLL